jgi:hypothetical protein
MDDATDMVRATKGAADEIRRLLAGADHALRIHYQGAG